MTLKQLKNLKKELSRSNERRHEFAQKLATLRATIDMPELYVDQNWNIVGYSDHFFAISQKVVQYAKESKHLKYFLKKGDFNKINEFREKEIKQDKYSFDLGGKWSLKYKGPKSTDEINRTWNAFNSCNRCKWEIIEEKEKLKLFHRPHTNDELDCYLMYMNEVGGANEDVRIIFKIRTSKNYEYIRDLSLVLSGSSGLEDILPDSVGYTVCIGSSNNRFARIQKKHENKVTMKEELKADTEYLVTVERIGGKIQRKMMDTQTGEEAPALEFVDSYAIYDRQNHIGFTTFSGAIEVYDLEIYSRKSAFAIDQFRIPFDIEVGINDTDIWDKIFRIRYGKGISRGKGHDVILFEDITEQKKAFKDIENLKEQWRNLSNYLQTVREDERTHIAREIHDELGQLLTTIKLELALISSKFGESNKKLLEQTESISNIVDLGIDSVHRIVNELRPSMLDKLGLTAACEWEINKFKQRTGIECTYSLLDEDIIIDQTVSTNVFRIFQEALTNIIRHSGASRVDVLLKAEEDQLILVVKDNGIGINEGNKQNPRSFGLIGIQERADFLSGSVTVKGIKNKGTTLNLKLPLNK